MDLDRQTRRQFCNRTCSTAALAALGGVLASVLESCGGGSSPTSASGGMALVRSASGNVLVAHTAQDAFTALSASCTHQGCAITGYADQAFVCPCHGARFDANGRVLSGPAPTALRQYQAQLADNVLTISA
jgi:cytochrome b6-f complex iron-sulfur subunit